MRYLRVHTLKIVTNKDKGKIFIHTRTDNMGQNLYIRYPRYQSYYAKLRHHSEGPTPDTYYSSDSSESSDTTEYDSSSDNEI